MIYQLTISDALKILKEYDQETIIKFGWGLQSGHANRGYYHELGLEPRYNVSIKEMISELESNIGATHYGWKGGEYTYYEGSSIHLSEEGSCGTPISNILLDLLLKDTV